MTMVHQQDRRPLEPLCAVLIVLVIATVGGGMLLLSAAEPTAAVDGAREWEEGSWLRAVVELLCLNHQFATEYAGDVKNYLLGFGAGLAAIAFGLASLIPKRTLDLPTAAESIRTAADTAVEDESRSAKAHVSPLWAAQILVVLYVGWAFASSRWARTPQHAQLAIAASAWLAMQFLWALTIGHGLSQRAAMISARAVFIILVVTSIIAIWYHYGRKPFLRAEFPVGNPVFFSVLIPGMTLALGFAMERFSSRRASPHRGSAVFLLAMILGLGIMAWTLGLADSRGTYVGLALAVLATFFFLFQGRMRLIPIGVTLVLIVLGTSRLIRASDVFSPTNRNATLSMRFHAWSYAWRLFQAKPLTGHGQGGYVLYGDTFAAEDVLGDPIALQDRMANAHNEWLEVLADLGSVGLVLIAGALLMTIHAGMVRLRNLPTSSAERFTLAALMGGLVGLMAAESSSVGLRISAVPTTFMTVLGLLWALARRPRIEPARCRGARPAWRIPVSLSVVLLGIVSISLAHQDFAAARNVRRCADVLRSGDDENAVHWATLANQSKQLNPQRALTNLFRLGEAHLSFAGRRLDRALDRQRRALETAPPNPRLRALAEEDFLAVALQCDQAADVLKELLVLSPGFIHHGKLAYQLNLTLAQLAAVRGEPEKEQALVRSAAAALERELRRQPFDPVLAAEYVRIAAGDLDTAAIIETLARPLRHNRITPAYVNVLTALADARNIEPDLADIERSSLAAVVNPTDWANEDKSIKTWAPETLRLVAMRRFLRGDYAAARDILRRAAGAYDAFWKSAPLGAASCYAEWADATFFAEPHHPQNALDTAQRARDLAPDSRPGRELRQVILTRMINYRLAAHQEDEALQLLRKIAPPNATDDDVRFQLAALYRHLCELLLRRRDAGGLLRVPPSDLLPDLRRWIARSIELNPDDPDAHLVLADLALHDGQDAQTAEHLRHAVDAGLPLDIALSFLQAARDRFPPSAPLADLLSTLEQEARQNPAGTTSDVQRPSTHQRRAPNQPMREDEPHAPSTSPATSRLP